MKTLLVSLCCLASVANAAGAVVQLDAKQTAALEAKVRSDREVHPRAFANVRALQAQVLTLDAKKRGRLAPVSPALKVLGPDAQWALVSALALDGALAADAPPSALIAWQVGLLEALGSLRSATSREVLLAALDANVAPEVTTAAAEALGKLGSDEAVTVLLREVRESDAHARAVERGLGSCRRLTIARYVAAELAKQPGDERARGLVRVLSQLGNAWGWQTTDGAPRADEAEPLRIVIVEALRAARVQASGELQQSVDDALAMVVPRG